MSEIILDAPKRKALSEDLNGQEMAFLTDLCARIPYGVICSIFREDDFGVGWRDSRLEGFISNKIGFEFYFEDMITVDNSLEKIKPYLRPMSSMTEEEKEYYYTFIDEFSIDNRYPQFTAKYVNKKLVDEYIDWLNAHHFDFRGLIEKGLAIAVTEENNPYEE